jgi:pimeloyl-ACP methyl ester carboxylesterase
MAQIGTGADLPSMNWPAARRLLKLTWIAVGLTSTAVFVIWSLIAFRAEPSARAAEITDAAVRVEKSGGARRFTPAGGASAAVGLLFFPGAMVDPTAYAPLARAIAETGVTVALVELPRRGALGGADQAELYERARAIMRSRSGPSGWVIAGHSRGAVVASQLASENPRGLAGVVLIGTTHPRDVDLSRLEVPVAKIVGTRDGIARPAGVEANRHLLPSDTRWTRIEGGNHSQFGWYGFQPGDRFARISADSQRALMLSAILETIRLAAMRRPDP